MLRLLTMCIPFRNLRKKGRAFLRDFLSDYDRNARRSMRAWRRHAVAGRTILILEPNYCHGEVLPGFCRHLLDMGYRVDVLMHHSLTGQSMEDIEIICVNDGSSDRTAEILREWRNRDRRVRIIDQKNSGVSAARNSGMAAAAGTYIGFVDPDDMVERNMFQRLVTAAAEKEADVAVCGYHEFCDRGGMDMSERGWSPSAGFFPEEKAERFRRGTPWSQCAGTVWNKLIRRELLEENGLRFVPGLSQGEDLYFCLMLLTFAPRLLILPDQLYHYRRERPGSSSCGRDPRLGDFRMDLMGMEALARFWGQRGLLDSPAAFGLVDYCMELMRRHFIMKEGAFFRASPEDREVLLSGWKKWLELVGAENVLPRLDRWDRAFCRLLLDYP